MAIATCSVLPLVLASAAHAQSGAVADRPSAMTELGELVVTAQRREERLQDVPISISVMDSEKLDGPTVQSLQDALRTVPGIYGVESNTNGLTQYTVRGVTSNASIFSGGSVIGYYLDEVPFAFVRMPLTPDAGSFDLDRVEVLRGPQGTLYGANSLNGVVRIITRDADLDNVEVKGRATVSSTKYASDPNYRADAALSIPLIPGKLAVRIVGGYDYSAGYIDDVLVARKEDYNKRLARNLRFKVNATPVEGTDIELLAWLSRSDRQGGPSSTPQRTNNAPGYDLDNNFDVYSAAITQEFPAFTLLSATSYVDYHNGLLVTAASGLVQIDQVLDGRFISQEVRLNSKMEGPWRWSAGAIYRDARDKRLQDDVRNFQFRGVLRQAYTSESYAFYGEVVRSLFDERVELTAGLRYYHDKVGTNEIGTLTGAAPYGLKEETFDAWTPRLILAYKPNREVNLYASYSQGFRSGFQQDGTVLNASRGFAESVNPDRLHNFEVGAKGSTLERRLAYDFSVYYVNWRDAVQVFPINIAPAGTTPQFVNAAVNSEAIRGLGVDAGLTFRLTDRLTIGGTLSWNDLHFSEAVVGANGVSIGKGLRPQGSPKVTAGANVAYVVPLGRDLQGRFNAAANYTSKVITPGAGGPTAEGDNLFYAEASFTVETPRGVDVTVFVENLTNEQGRIRQSTTAAGLSDRFRPRTFGVQLDVAF